jgi:membrane protein DedA with SNARE-associated domain
VADAAGTEGLTGISGWVLDVIAAAGEVGVGLLALVETVFPPVPSEVVLPLAGYLTERGRLGLAGVLVAATLGSVLGALLLYGLAARLGQSRATALLARLPLLDEEDVQQAVAWFDRHGPAAVLLGRLVPGVRSLVSLPAGAVRMPLLQFTALTLLGSAVWNALLIGAGVALGTQWRTVERYSGWLDAVLVGGVVLALLLLVRHRLRKRRRASS